MRKAEKLPDPRRARHRPYSRDFSEARDRQTNAGFDLSLSKGTTQPKNLSVKRIAFFRSSRSDDRKNGFELSRGARGETNNSCYQPMMILAFRPQDG